MKKSLSAAGSHWKNHRAGHKRPLAFHTSRLNGPFARFSIISGVLICQNSLLGKNACKKTGELENKYFEILSDLELMSQTKCVTNEIYRNENDDHCRLSEQVLFKNPTSHLSW